MNKYRAPKIPPILHGGSFVLSCIDKVKLFNQCFPSQRKRNKNNSKLPDFEYLITGKRIDSIYINETDILHLVRNLDPFKAAGSDGISGRMLLLCDTSIATPLKIIFQNILYTSIYPDMWKLANVTPIFKKGDKQLVKNYRPISLLPICSKLFEKLIFNSLYGYLRANGLITNNQSGFRPGDSTTYQLLFLLNEIHKAFDDPKCLEVRAIFFRHIKSF